MNYYWWSNNHQNGHEINWQRWGRLWRRKDSGGLGFCNLYYFNLMLLGKLGWKLFAEPLFLVIRILKARVFSIRDFLNANIRHEPSYVWQNILSSKELDIKGIRWWIGTSSKVIVWSTAWLNNNSNKYIETRMMKGLESMLVSDLIIDSRTKWDWNLLNSLFQLIDALSIMSIPLSSWKVDDTNQVRSEFSLKISINQFCDISHTSISKWAEIL